MKLATADDLAVVESSFRAYKDIFPFIRRDFLQREIAAGRVLYDHGMVAIVKQMQRAGHSGTWRYERGYWQMPELVRTAAASPMGALTFFRALLSEHVGDNVLFGTIREDNTYSVKWHLAMGYKRVGDIAWKNGTLPGGVYAYDNRKESLPL